MQVIAVSPSRFKILGKSKKEHSHIPTNIVINPLLITFTRERRCMERNAFGNKKQVLKNSLTLEEDEPKAL